MRFLSKLILVLLALTGIPRPLQATGSWDVGPTPLDIMQKAGVPANVDAISEILVDAAREEQFRFWAALALGQLGDDGAIPVLLFSLSDQIVLVRLGAATALGYIPSEKSTQPLCKTALHDHDPAPRHGAVTSLSAVMTDATTQCLVRVAVNEQETTKVRLLSLNLLEQQTQERQGFEELIPALDDPNPDVKGMAAIILSIEYVGEPEVLESLSVTESLVVAILDAGPQSYAYLRMVKRLEVIAAREFIGESDNEVELLLGNGRAEVNDRIKEWVAENRVE